MIRLAITGCGLIAPKKHIPTLLRLKDKVEIVALCDLNEVVVKKVAEKFGIKKYYTDFSDMLSGEKLDVIDICTPPQTHARLAIEALEMGCHVILEKPMALSLKDCDVIIQTATKCSKRVGVIHNQLFNPAMLEALNIVRSGAIGDFLGVQIFLSTPTDYITSTKDHWAHKLPGGVLGETGPHSVYLTTAFLKNIYDVDVHAKKLLTEYPWSVSEDFRINLFAGNGIGTITQIYGSNQWAADIEVFCTRGILKIDLQNKSVIRYNRPKLAPLALGIGVLDNVSQTLLSLARTGLNYFVGKRGDAHFSTISEFINCIFENKPFPTTGEDGRETVLVMEMLVKNFEGNTQKQLVSK